MRQEADAAAQRVGSAGALPDPVLRVELMNINNYGNDASPSLLPSKVGETKYTADADHCRSGASATCGATWPPPTRAGQRAQRSHLDRAGDAHQDRAMPSTTGRSATSG